MVFTVVLFVSFVCLAICIYWLTKNGEAMEETYRICVEEADRADHNRESDLEELTEQDCSN